MFPLSIILVCTRFANLPFNNPIDLKRVKLSVPRLMKCKVFGNIKHVDDCTVFSCKRSDLGQCLCRTRGKIIGHTKFLTSRGIPIRFLPVSFPNGKAGLRRAKEFHSCSVKVKLSASLKKQAQISVRQVADKILPACLMQNDFLRKING